MVRKEFIYWMLLICKIKVYVFEKKNLEDIIMGIFVNKKLYMFYGLIYCLCVFIYFIFNN